MRNSTNYVFSNGVQIAVSYFRAGKLACLVIGPSSSPSTVALSIDRKQVKRLLKQMSESGVRLSEICRWKECKFERFAR